MPGKKFDSGEGVLISITQTGIRITQQKLMGLLPGDTIYECTVSDLKSAIDKFEDIENPGKHPLDAIKDKILNCRSINDVKKICK